MKSCLFLCLGPLAISGEDIVDGPGRSYCVVCTVAKYAAASRINFTGSTPTKLERSVDVLLVSEV